MINVHHSSLITHHYTGEQIAESVLVVKSKAFVLRIVKLHQYLRGKKESVMTKQVLRYREAIVHTPVVGYSLLIGMPVVAARFEQSTLPISLTSTCRIVCLASIRLRP